MNEFAKAASQPLQLRTEFTGLPPAWRLTRSEFFIVPFRDDLDFESFEMLGRGREQPWPRTLLNYSQKYEVLSAVLERARHCCRGTGAQFILNSRMPSTLRMPPAMLGDDIFVALDVATEARRYVERGRSVVTLEESLLRYAIEAGANELTVTWHLPPPDGDHRIRSLASDLLPLGFSGKERHP